MNPQTPLAADYVRYAGPTGSCDTRRPTAILKQCCGTSPIPAAAHYHIGASRHRESCRRATYASRPRRLPRAPASSDSRNAFEALARR